MKIKNLSKAICYLRTATTKPEHEKNSLENQRKSIFKWAKENNIKIIKVYSEIGSGYRGECPVLDSMIKDIDEEVLKPEAIVVYTHSRLSRSSSRMSAIQSLLNEKSIELTSIMEPFSSNFNPTLNMQGVINLLNELQRKKTQNLY